MRGHGPPPPPIGTTRLNYPLFSLMKANKRTLIALYTVQWEFFEDNKFRCFHGFHSYLEN